MQQLLSKEDIGRRLKELRLSTHKSQTDFAKEIGLTRGNYAQIEMGKQYPSYEVLINISRQFEKSYEWILHGYEMSVIADEIYSDIFKSTAEQLTAVTPAEPFFIRDKDEKELAVIVEASQFTNYISNRQNERFFSLLPVFSFPAADKSNKKLRAFEMADNSMKATFCKGDLLIGKSIRDLSQLKESTIYVLVTSAGILVQRFCFFMKEMNYFVGCTDSKRFDPLVTDWETISEIWEITSCLTSDFSVPAADSGHFMEMASSILEIKMQMNILRNANRSAEYKLA